MKCQDDFKLYTYVHVHASKPLTIVFIMTVSSVAAHKINQMTCSTFKITQMGLT